MCIVKPVLNSVKEIRQPFCSPNHSQISSLNWQKIQFQLWFNWTLKTGIKLAWQFVIKLWSYFVQSSGGQNFFEGVQGFVEPLSWRHINLGDDNEERQFQGHHNVQVLVGHCNNAGIRTHLVLKTTRGVQTTDIY